MDDDARRVYRGFAIAFVAIGGGVLLLQAAQTVFGFTWLSGDPSPVGLLLAAVGAALWWTARRREP